MQAARSACQPGCPIASLDNPQLTAGMLDTGKTSPSQQATPRPQSVHSKAHARCPDRMRAVLFWMVYQASESFHVRVVCSAVEVSVSLEAA